MDEKIQVQIRGPFKDAKAKRGPVQNGDWPSSDEKG